MTQSAPLIARPDTLFGVCEGIGRDLGFNPLLLRIALGVGVLWNPVLVLATYAALGIVVFVTRWAFPDPAPAVAPDAAPDAIETNDTEPFKLAA